MADLEHGDSFYSRISRVDASTPTERALAQYFIDRFPQLAFDKLDDVCQAAHTSTASVLRYIRKLGYKDFRAFSQELRAEVAENFDSPADRRVKHDGVSGASSMFRQRVNAAMTNLQDMSSLVTDDDFATVVDLVRDSTRTLYLVNSAGDASLIMYFYAMAHYHRDNMVLIPTLALRGSELVGADERSVMLVSAFDRSSFAARAALELMRERGATSVLLTNRASSPLLPYADHTIVIPSVLQGRMSSRVGFLVFFEALAAAMENEQSTARSQAIRAVDDELGLYISPTTATNSGFFESGGLASLLPTHGSKSSSTGKSGGVSHGYSRSSARSGTLGASHHLK
ncbi:MAG: MurR/RpiR family transcriptional regulator [Actinomycetaceae bacterium]|nr:MurR/RpiR family transcriptional regulator [Actinomycetaceae bacterium]MDY6083099.1 MurR/RpiR family transcriptional regulator [Actinomycetaceae bacterium]